MHAYYIHFNLYAVGHELIIDVQKKKAHYQKTEYDVRLVLVINISIS